MTPARFNQLDQTLMTMTGNLAKMSLATRSKVGALVYKDGRVVSMGWNGMPSGLPNEEIEYYKDGVLTTNPLALHAEGNALMKCARLTGSTTEGATLFVTMSPCMDCVKLIIQAGICKVLYRDEYRDTSGLDVLKRVGIEVKQLDELTIVN